KVIVDGKEVDPRAFLKQAEVEPGNVPSALARIASIDPREHMRQVVSDYFRLPEGPRRQEFLDRMIDQQERARKELEKAAAVGAGTRLDLAQPATQGVEGVPRRTVVIRGGAGIMDAISPELRAQLAEYTAALNRRRVERGLSPQQDFMIFRNKAN
ncbi:MAG: hypothetical protein RMJ35_01980, partial [Phycisphaerales bacterium]|nr:hypothetical protein [Phycisphaerales bacterium]